MDLVVCVWVGGGGHWALRILRPTERLVTVSQFADTVSTAAIKIVDGAWRCSPSLSIL
jgi:hypothetical protein